MEERVALFREYETGAFSVTELCARHGVSRETFYVWKRRRENGGPHWFEERSHATKSCPHATEGQLAKHIVATRQRFPHFGPKKIKAWLEHERPEVDWPAASTIGDILKREGLVEARRRRRRAIAQGEVAAPASAPNEEWAIDFKGWFRTRDGNRCDPLTITDAASRYLIEVRIVDPTWSGVKALWNAFSARSAFPPRSAPTMVHRLDRRGRAAFRRSRYGGSSSVSNRATSPRRARRTTAGTSACTAR
ncbi:helix-turn-helix domain-containing protein [Bradyrhizobium sp. BEA-2-5]|uniref:helix-turn-helix domain-containing protein n=1 Tax=Bradyrhizobium sp. BEA-2-5 TaxID=3080015 RepID=UPI00293E9F2C|nr:helix-turn-helix domain-containing protein [Bradyrhizobium sp. BEA-2-5]WOH80411.1 helix-turn-helix domain-containing protein [Bradyrhizobium sp. BEA-2-5]